MSITAEDIQALSEIGLSAEHLAAVLKVMATKDERAREIARDKKRRQRAMSSDNDTLSPIVPGQTGTDGDKSGQEGTEDQKGFPPFSPLPLSSKPPIPIPPIIPPSKNTRGQNLHELPENFEPDEESLRFCLEKSVDFDEAMRDLRDWTRAKRPRYHDWQAVFRNNVKRIAEKEAKNGQKKSDWISEGNRLAAKYAAEAELERRREAKTIACLEQDLHSATAIRQDSPGAGNSG